MKSQSLRSALIALLFALFPLAAAHAQNLGDNAALVYWQAIAQVPELSDDEHKTLDDWSAQPNAARAELVGRLNAAVKLASQAAAMERSDWGIDMSPGPHTLLPHLAKMRQLSRIVLAAATEQMRQNQPQEAVELAITVMRMARHLEPQGTLIEMLVQVAIEHQAERWIALHAPRMTPEARRYVLAELDRLPPAATTASSMEGEKLFIVWTRRQIQNNNLAAFRDLAQPRDPQAEALARTDPQTLTKWLDQTDQWFDQIIIAVQRPYPEPGERIGRLMKQIEGSDNLFAKLLFPSVERVWIIEHGALARLAILQAGLLRLNKDDRAKALIDPYSDPAGTPFKVIEHDGGFTLQSRIERDGKPVELSFGVAAEK